MNLPEFRCLICDKVLAEGTDAAVPRETCTQCGKSTLMNLDAVVAAEIVVPLTPARELPTVFPTKPPAIPDVFPKARVIAPAVPTVQRKQTELFRPDAVPDAERPTPKLGFALFITFLTMVAIVLALTVLISTIVLGLKNAAKRGEPVPTARIATVPSAGK